jgi:S1-C subfamily serine protease
MEELNKNQLILLVLLVSFVTSIGTGIITVSLLMEAPIEVTQTINRVVEKTIETVTPDQKTTTGTQKTKEVTTVVVTEDDQVISAIEKNTKSIVRIHEKNTSLDVDNLYGLGIVIGTNGIIATDKKNISEVMQYEAVMYDGTKIPLVYVYADKKASVGFFKAKPEKPYTFTPISYAGANPQLGQSIVVIGGDNTNAINVGRITTLNTKDLGTSTPKEITSIVTDVSPTDGISGSPVFSLSGELIGLSLSSFSSTKIYIPAFIIKKEALLLEAPKSSV